MAHVDDKGILVWDAVDFETSEEMLTKINQLEIVKFYMFKLVYDKSFTTSGEYIATKKVESALSFMNLMINRDVMKVH